MEGTPDNGPRPMMVGRMIAPTGGTPAAIAGQIEVSESVTATYDLYYK